MSKPSHRPGREDIEQQRGAGYPSDEPHIDNMNNIRASALKLS